MQNLFLGRYFVDILLNVDQPNVVEIHVPKVRVRCRVQICTAVSVGLDIGLFVHFKKGECPRGKCHRLRLAAADDEQLHLILYPIGPDLLFRGIFEFYRVKALAE